MKKMTALSIAWDGWLAKRQGLEGILQRQNSRVNTIVEYAREHSRFYREKYQHVHFPIENIQQLPHVSKPELMASFNDWVTDPAIKREDVEAFAADKSKIGGPFPQWNQAW